MKFVLTTGSGCGSSCVLTANADTTINTSLSTSNNYPWIKWHCDTATVPGTWTITQWPANNNSNTAVSLSSTLSASTAYTCYLYFEGGDLVDSGNNSWTGTGAQTKVNSLTLDTGATVVQPTLRPNLCMFWGASYEQGYFGLAQTGPVYNFVDQEQGWTGGVAQAAVLNCEYGLVGIGGQGWQNPGGGGYPVFGSSWNGYDSTHSKSFSTPPTYVVVHQSENDHSYSTGPETSAVSSWIPAARSAFGSATKIFLVGALGSELSAINTAIQAGITASGDAQTFWISPGTQFSLTTFSTGCTASSWASPDCLHVTAVYQNQIYGTMITAAIMKNLYQQNYAPTHVILGSLMGVPWKPGLALLAFSGIWAIRRRS